MYYSCLQFPAPVGCWDVTTSCNRITDYKRQSCNHKVEMIQIWSDCQLWYNQHPLLSSSRPDTLIELLNFIWRNFDWCWFIFRMFRTAGYILDNWWDSNLTWSLKAHIRTRKRERRERESVLMSSECITSNGVATTGNEIRQMYSPLQSS